MKTLIAWSILCICIAWGDAVRSEDLVRLDLDRLDNLGLQFSIDRSQNTEGKGSLKIETQWPTTVCLGVVEKPDIEQGKLVYSADVKCDLEGRAFLEMWCYVGGKPYFSRGLDAPAEGSVKEWKGLKTPFIFQKGQRPDQVVLNIVIQGKGTLWVDNLVLSKTAFQ